MHRAGASRKRATAFGVAFVLIAGLGLALANFTTATAGAVLLSGTVTNSNGTLADRGTVVVAAWPSGATQDAMPNGDPSATLTMTTVGQYNTNAAGRYTVTADLATLPTDYKDANGGVNLQIDSTDDLGNMQSFSVPAAVPGSFDAADPAIVTAGSRAGTVNFDLSRARVTSRIGVDADSGDQAEVNTSMARVDTSATAQAGSTDQLASAAERASAAQEDAVASKAAMPDGDTVTICGSWWSEGYYPTRQENFAYFYDYTANKPGYIREETGASHETAYGTAVTGGSWSLGGTITTSTSEGSGGDHSYYANHRMFNTVNVHHWMRNCHQTYPYKQWYEHSVHMSTFRDLISSAPALPNREWGSCSYKNGGHYFKNTGRGHTISVGITAPFINLTAEESYSTHTEQGWYPDHAYLCGDYKSGWASSHIVGTTLA